MMRILHMGLLFLGIAPALQACGPPSVIKFPGVVRHAVLRGDHLLCVNDAERLIAVDLKRGRTFDLGASADKRWYDGDVADGRALMIEKDRLLVVGLTDGKPIHAVAIGGERTWAFGFAGKDRAFVHRGKSLAILELTTGKNLHTIQLGDDSWPRGAIPWQKVGNRLFIVGPATTLCVIDLEAGKLCDRISVEARASIQSLHVEGTSVFCIGNPFGWGARVDHLVSVDLESKTCRLVDLPREIRKFGRFANGPYGTMYLIEGNRIDRYTMAGSLCSSFKMPGGEAVLAVWQQHAIIGRVNEIRLEEIKETPVARR